MTRHNSDGPASAAFTPGPVLLLGAPGVGKGTQAKLLMEKFSVPQISTGDLLRKNVQEQTALGVAAKLLMDRGQLVPDDVVNGMVADRLLSPDTAQGYILDGFPRTQVQADWLDQELERQSSATTLVAIQIHVEEIDLLQRITGRRTCSLCRHIYNIYSHPPAKGGVCDFDGAPLMHRSDDTEEAFGKRMAEYASKTAAVIDHYRARGRFRKISGVGSLQAVEERIVEALHDLRNHAIGAV